uniref:C-type lectin domain-containing protein n=1 Tax=Meloidogyne hapla TaxID=6305 RepID=A0A1I8B3I5_MELHA
MYKGYDDKKINWNDIACYHKLGGAICKRQCGGGGGGQVCPCTVQTCGTAGWTKGKEGSGNAGREYKVFNIPSPGNYWQALAVCASNGAKVASYHSEDQKNAITHICQSSNCAWIGLHTSPSGTKYWDDGSQYNYQNLLEQSLCQRNPTSPNCGGGNPPPSANCPKDCTAVSSAGQTTDQSCESSCGSVICEKECVIKS